MEYTSVKNKEISITMEDAQRSNKIVVWGTFYGKNGKSFQAYFDTVEKACAYYNKKIKKATEIFLEKMSKID